MNRLIVVICLFFNVNLSAQSLYPHNTIWGRLALSDTLSKKIKWEIFIQHRRQSLPDNQLSVLKAPLFTNYWVWLSYFPSKNLKLSVSPFGYFKTWGLIAKTNEIDNDAVLEYRFSARVEQEQRLKSFIYANRYTLEYRLRNLKQAGVFLPNWRIRYQARLEYPFKNLKKPLSFTVSDEIFMQFGQAVKGNPNVFDQNRLYAGFNYGLMKNVKFSLGYIFLIQQRPSGTEFDQANVLWGILTFENLFSQFRKHK